MPRTSDTKLTDKLIARKHLPARGAAPIEIFDEQAPGLCVRLMSGGTRSFVLSYRENGKQRRRTLGTYLHETADAAGYSLRQARLDAHMIKNRLSRGLPAIEPPAAPVPVPVGAVTFGEIADKYVAIEILKLARGAEVKSIIERELKPALGHLAFGAVTKQELRAVMNKLNSELRDGDKIVRPARPAAALKTFEVAKRLAAWWCEEDGNETTINPLAGMKPKIAKVRRSRFLSDDEIRDAWNLFNIVGYPFGPLQKMLLVTGQRRGEVAGMRWSEIDLDAATWIIPARRFKSDHPHLVPLSDLAIEVLRLIPQPAEPKGEYVFSTTNGEKAVSGFSKARGAGLVNPKTAGDRWRWHDLRRTCRTSLPRVGTAETVSERVIGHGPKDVLVATYNLYEFRDEKAVALQKWADLLRQIIHLRAAAVSALPRPNPSAVVLPIHNFRDKRLKSM